VAVNLKLQDGGILNMAATRSFLKLQDGGKFKYGGVCEFTTWRYFKYGSYARRLSFKMADFTRWRNIFI
jgi:hypothetical protein